MVLRSFVVACAALALGVGAGLAAEEPAKQSSCVQARSIHQWDVIDDRTAYIYTSPTRKFKVTFVGTCRDMKYAHFAEIERRASSGICLAPGDEIVFSRRHPRLRSDEPYEAQHCMIKSVEAVPHEDEKPAGGQN